MSARNHAVDNLIASYDQHKICQKAMPAATTFVRYVWIAIQVILQLDVLLLNSPETSHTSLRSPRRIYPTRKQNYFVTEVTVTLCHPPPGHL